MTKAMMTIVIPAVCVLLFLAACGDDPPTNTGDTTPPRAVVDLTARPDGPATVNLSWTSPGDNGDEGRASGFEVRGARTAFDESDWERLELLDAGRPRESGRTDSATVRGLELGIWYFGVRVVDEASNWSPLSNLADVEVTGIVAPDAITDLQITEFTAGTVTLTWTAPATQEGALYDVRYAKDELSEATWSAAIPRQGEIPPGAPGTVETLVIDGLSASTTYVFGVKTANEPPNWSPLSNLVTTTTDELEIRRITNSTRTAGAQGPHWSPDGTRILFFADWERQFYGQLYAIDPGTLETERFTSFAEGTFQGQWSPDGTQIGFIGFRPDGPNTWKELWTMAAQPGATATLLASHAPRPIHDLTWSPDGSHVAYTVGSPFGGLPSPDSLFVVPIGSREPEFLLTTGAPISGPQWSPDGNQIAFGGGQAGSLDIWIYSLDSGETRRFSDDPADDIRPAWSSDGEHIAFGSNRSGNWDVWTVRADGSEPPIQRTFAPTTEIGASWSPDGRQIAFSATDEVAARSDIYILTLR